MLGRWRGGSAQTTDEMASRSLLERRSDGATNLLKGPRKDGVHCRHEENKKATRDRRANGLSQGNVGGGGDAEAGFGGR